MQGVVRYLGLKMPVSTDFANQQMAQKGIYWAQVMGVDLLYQFSWYIHGPYCSPLTRHLESLEDEKWDDVDMPEITQEARGALDKAKRLLRHNPSEVADHEWQQILASAHYLHHGRTEPQGYKGVAEFLHERKPSVASKLRIRLAWDTLNEHGLLRCAA